MKEKLKKLIIRLPALIIAAAIWVLSAQSILPKPKGIFGFDKFQHMLAYGALAFCIGLWFSRDQWDGRPRRFVLLSAVIASVYGISDEVHQYFVPGRDCNVYDWLADTLGALLGAALIRLVLRFVRERRDRPA